MHKPNMRNGLSTTGIVLIIVAVFVVAGIVWSVNSGDESPAGQEATTAVVNSSDDNNLDRREGGGDFNDVVGNGGVSDEEAQDESPEVAEQDSLFTGSVVAGSVSPLLDFERHDYELALASDKLVMLYFHANWCGTCKAEKAAGLHPAFNEIMHDRVVGFQVNFNDDETDDFEKQLARDFGVTYQQAKVFLRNGEVVLQAPDVWSKEKYLDTIGSLI